MTRKQAQMRRLDAYRNLIAHPNLRWVLLLIVTAAIVITAVRSYREIDNELTAVTLLRREAVVKLIAATLTEKFGRISDIAVSLATRVRFSELVAQGNWNDAITIMRSVPEDFPAIERLFLTDVDGTLKADVPASPGVRGVNFAHRKWYQGVSQQWKTHLSPIYERQALPKLKVFAISTPIRSKSGHVAGILVLQLQFSKLLEWLPDINAGPKSAVYIVDQEGQVAFHSRHPDWVGTSLAISPFVTSVLYGKTNVEIDYDPIEGEESIVAYAPISAYGWGVIVQQPVRYSLGLETRDEQLQHLLVGYAAILLLSVFSILLVTRIGRERQRAEQRFRAVAETANDAVISANRNGNIIYVNPAVELIFGYTASEIIGQPLTMIMPERYHQPHNEGLKRVLEGGEARVIGRTVELVGRRKDGSEFPVELSLSSWKSDDDTYFTGILRDITKRQAAQKQLHDYANQLEATNKELEAFSYSVSHDLRAPLRGIDGFSQALLDDYGNTLDDQAKNYLQRVRAATMHMAELIDDMLNLARVTRAPMRQESVDLSALAGSIVEEMRTAHPEHEVDIVIQSGLQTTGDAKLLRIMLENLLANAWKFTGKTPTPRVEFGAEQGENTVYFVRDNGAGFDMAYAQKMFGAFQRLHSAGEFPGTGIGLATVQRIVHRHGGKIWAEGAVNKGASFYFTL